jgi:hypothetical protein
MKKHQDPICKWGMRTLETPRADALMAWEKGPGSSRSTHRNLRMRWKKRYLDIKRGSTTISPCSTVTFWSS